MDPSYFILFVFINVSGALVIYFFHRHTKIQPKYMTLFHLFHFLLCTTIQQKIKLLIINLFLLYAHKSKTKNI